MASGTGNLPNPGMVFTPFDILTAEEQNQLVENIESVADASGIGDGAITSDKIDFTTLGVKIGAFSFPTSTGPLTITGVGFKPRLVRFNIIYISDAGTAYMAYGAATATNNYASGIAVEGSTRGMNHSQSHCIISTGATGNIIRGAALSSMNDDGFVLNITNASSTSMTVAYEAWQ